MIEDGLLVFAFIAGMIFATSIFLIIAYKQEKNKTKLNKKVK
jgi:hypothetical protein